MSSEQIVCFEFFGIQIDGSVVHNFSMMSREERAGIQIEPISLHEYSLSHNANVEADSEQSPTHR